MQSCALHGHGDGWLHESFAPGESPPGAGAVLRRRRAAAQCAYARASEPQAGAAASGTVQASACTSDKGDATGRAYAAVVQCEARWFLLPHEAEHALAHGIDLAVL
jgi:hypothetical protein